MDEKMIEAVMGLARVDPKFRRSVEKMVGAARASSLEADNARLRALIKQAEYGDHTHYEDSCPWCGCVAIGHRWTKLDEPPHSDDCPAFTPTGEVK